MPAIKANASPWNAGRFVGPRLAFSVEETQAIAEMLHQKNVIKELCIFCFGIDSMLRVSDLQRVRVCDIVNDKGAICTTFIAKQQKTARRVDPVLTKHTRAICKLWIARGDKHSHDLLFTNERHPSDALSASWYQRAVKRWAAAIGLVPDHYSAHSLRRTKARFLYFNCNVDIAIISTLLGHKNTDATLTYLGVLNIEAQQAALFGDIFTAKHNAYKDITTSKHPFLKPEIIKTFSDAVAKKVIAELKKQENKK